MLKISVPSVEYYNEETESFVVIDAVDLELEHSLISLSKWESKYERPFLTNETKSGTELYYYIEAMVLSPNCPKDLAVRLSQDNLDTINAYIDSAQSATTFGEMPERKGRGETITAELIYYWMVAFNIPFECERWHLNRLFALIRICNIKNSKPKKMSRGEIARRNAEINKARREQLGTSG